jgi:hypothetical protein
MASATTTSTQSLFGTSDSYKYRWARHVARRTLEKDLEAVKLRIAEIQKRDISGTLTPDFAPGESVSIGDLAKITEKTSGIGLVPPEQGRLKVGIVGAGAAGLFTAMVFDWLNLKVTGLHIDYDFLEAAGEKRMGGRLYTHKFSEKEHDYYDVGAMRFPDNDVMKR